MSSSLVQRGITGLIFVAVMTGGVFMGPYAFFPLFGLITALCLWEFFNIVLVRIKRRDLLRRSLGIGLGMVPFVLAMVWEMKWFQSQPTFIAASSLLFFPIMFTTFIYELYTRSETPFRNVAFLVLGTVYIGIPFSLLCFAAFKGGTYQPEIVIGLLLMNWLNDSGAYLIGSRYGKTPLFPRISPKKTWEGGAGGLLGAATGALLMSAFSDVFPLQHWLALSVIVVCFGDLGDLVESMLKRSFSIKDSGDLLPGHGGFLDRFDAFIFLIPFSTVYILLVC